MNAETISDLYSVSAQELSNSNAKYILVEGRKERKGGRKERKKEKVEGRTEYQKYSAAVVLKLVCVGGCSSDVLERWATF